MISMEDKLYKCDDCEKLTITSELSVRDGIFVLCGKCMREHDERIKRIDAFIEALNSQFGHELDTRGGI